MKIWAKYSKFNFGFLENGPRKNFRSGKLRESNRTNIPRGIHESEGSGGFSGA